MAATRIHHLNFVVRDLEAAMDRFETVLGVAPFEIVDHAPRGSRIARSRVGESWLVLVCPYDDESVPGRFLAERGEGFFLLSIGRDDFDAHLERVVGDRAEVRGGILDWEVADVGDAFGAVLQLTRDG